MENGVFIAWSRNESLAHRVAEEIEKNEKLARYGFRGIVGGGRATERYVGEQIERQIADCRYAIVLARRLQEAESCAFSDNVMYECGYLIAKLGFRAVRIFVEKNDMRYMPSDLQGNWLLPMDSTQSEEMLAADIVARFAAEVEIERINKMQRMSLWLRVKEKLNDFRSGASFSEREIAKDVLFCMEATYYHGDLDAFSSLLEGIAFRRDLSAELKCVLETVHYMVELYRLVDGNAFGSLPEQELRRIVRRLGAYNEESLQDKEIRAWMRILVTDMLSFAYCLFLNDDTVSEGQKRYLEKAERYLIETEQLLDEDARAYREESCDPDYFYDLFYSYVYRNRQFIAEKNGNLELAEQYLMRSLQTRERLYENYRLLPYADEILVLKFEQEYYLALMEQILFYVKHHMERLDIERAEQALDSVAEALEGWQGDLNRRRAMVERIKTLHAEAEDALLP